MMKGDFWLPNEEDKPRDKKETTCEEKITQLQINFSSVLSLCL